MRQVGDGVVFGTGGERWLKFCFEIEVEEMGEGEVEVEVVLDPEEYQAFVWAGEEDVRGGRYPVVTGEMQQLMLRAFELRRGG